MTITAKQIADRRITQTIFIPLQRAIELDKEAKRLGISKNKLVNSCIDFGLENKEKMKIVDVVPSVGGRATNHTPAAEAVENTTTTTKEVAAL